MYEPQQYANLLLIDSADKIYVEVIISIPIYAQEEYKVYPVSDVANASGGKDFGITIRVSGVQSGIFKIEKIQLTLEILDSAAVDKPGVVAAVDDNLYGVTTTVYQDGAPVKTTTGTISKNSDIEII